MKFFRVIHFVFVLFILSCHETKETKDASSFTLRTFESNGQIVSKDSLKPPVIVKASVGKRTEAKPPVLVPSNTNFISVDYKNIVSQGSIIEPRIAIPGTDSLLLPELNVTKELIVLSGEPEVISAKSPFSKDKNPYNFSSYKILQGLKQQNIRCLIQDHFGNLWLGTRGGGVIRFDGKDFAHFSVRQGLCNEFVWSMLEDSKGNIWIGSQFGGVDKFDGKSFTNYSSKNGLSNDVVYSMFEDKQGKIWFSTENGFSIFDGTSFKHYGLKQGLSSGVIWNMYQDRQGNTWLGTNLGGLIKFDGKQFSIYTEKEGAPFKSVYKITEDQNGNVIIGADCGVYKLINNRFVSLLTHNKNQDLSVYGLQIDKNNNLWCASYGGGLYKIEENGYTHITSDDGLSGNILWDILQDKNGNLWFSSTTGLMSYSGETFTHFTDNEGLTSSLVSCINEDEKGDLWFSTSGGGVNVYDGKSFKSYGVNQGLHINSITCALKDSKGKMWFGSLGSGVSMFDGQYFYNYSGTNGFGNNIILCMEEARDGSIWIGFEGALIKYKDSLFTSFDNRNGLSNNIVRCIKEDSKGNIWIGTSNGLTRMSKDNVFTRFYEEDGLLNKLIISLQEDKNGNLWITTPEGVMMYDGLKFTYFTVKEGLCNNYVSSCYEDKHGDIWFGTMNGLSKLLVKNIENKKQNSDLPLFKNYFFEDGFLGVSCRKDALLEDKNGNIWIGTSDRLTLFHKEADVKDSISPSIQISSVELFNEQVDWHKYENKQDTNFTLSNGIKISGFSFKGTSNWYNVPNDLSLAYNNNNITIKYIGISPKQSNVIKYKYKLEPIDKNWSSLTNRNEVNFGNLPFGDYTFKVKAMSGQGYWSDEIVYHFSVRPPWWKTWWFYVTSTLLSVLVLLGFYQYRTASLRERQKELELTVKSRTAEVTAQKIEIEEHRKEILDSINYAKRIQYALLASDHLLTSNLPEHFVLFKPKDIVSGDFYWATPTPEGFVLLAGDCTGHGVPGAFMSLLNISKLSQTINENKIYRPDLVLNNVRSEIVRALNPEGTAEQSKDGMDAILCKMNLKELKLEYASANNSFYIIRDSEEGTSKELMICKPDKMPVGAGYGDVVPFTFNELHLKKGDMIYLLTDGYADQFGGDKGKKFKYKQLEEILLSISGQTMEHQKQHLEEAFLNWKKNLEQVDDVCILGIRV